MSFNYKARIYPGFLFIGKLLGADVFMLSLKDKK